MGHIISRINKSETPSKLIYFDSESYVDTEISQEDVKNVQAGNQVTKEHSLYLLCANFVCTKKKEKKDDWIDYKGSVKEIQEGFWNDACKFTHNKQKVFVIAHNAKYDVLVTGCIPEMISNGFFIESYSDSNPFFIVWTNKQCNHECKECDYLGDRGCLFPSKTIVILSSTNFYNVPLWKLGKTFKLNKGEIDYSNQDIATATEYCRNDVLILKTAMESYIDFIKIEDIGNFKYTLAGQSFTAYRKRFMDKEIYIHRCKDALILERNSYSGGRTECFYIGKAKEKLYYLDVNSLYPYVMKVKKFPTMLITHRKRGDVETLQEIINDGKLITAKVIVNTKQNVFFTKTDKLIFPVGRFETSLSTPELIYGIKHKLIESVLEYNVYDGEDIFSEYVSYFYGKRLEASEADNEVLKYLFKIFMNSLYGKFGQKQNFMERVGDYLDCEVIREEKVLDVDTGLSKTIKIFGGGVFSRINLPDGENEAFNSFPAIAAHVTAEARMLLWKYMLIGGRKNIYYCDTDSLFINEAGYNRLNEKGFVNNKVLGKLKLEQVSNDVVIRGCKDYHFGEEHKLKGVPKKALKIDDNHYIVTIWEGLNKKIKEGDLRTYKNILMEKELKREYTKGIVTGNRVKPINF